MPSKSILTFIKYDVDKLIYEPFDIKMSGEMSYKPVFQSYIDETKGGDFTVKLSAVITGTVEQPFPFRIEAAITGYFHLDSSGISDNIKDSIMSKNTVSILFPFLRTIIASLTSAANITPLILPVINLNDSEISSD